MRFAFYVSGKATRLQKALKIMSKKYPALIKLISFILIDNQTNDRLKKICSENHIRYFEIDLSSIEKKEKSIYVSDKLVQILKDGNVDYLFIFCTLLLKGKLLEIYNNKIINFHPSLLPNYKGFLAIDQALKNDAFILGNSAHFINDKADDGPIIMQSILHRSSYTKYDDILDMQIPMLIQIMFWLTSKRIKVLNKIVKIERADYKIGNYVPQIEIDL